MRRAPGPFAVRLVLGLLACGVAVTVAVPGCRPRPETPASPASLAGTWVGDVAASEAAVAPVERGRVRALAAANRYRLVLSPDGRFEATLGMAASREQRVEGTWRAEATRLHLTETSGTPLPPMSWDGRRLHAPLAGFTLLLAREAP